jgi:Fic-DOC domain mobile mystery protein B
VGIVNEKWELIDDETPFDLSHLRDRALNTRPKLNRAEADNILKATLKYLAVKPSKRSAPFDFDWLLRLHQEMFGDVWLWAGKLRQENLNIGIEWSQVPLQLENLLLDMGYWQATPEKIIEDAATLHYRAVHIHPFYGGNGRWSRFLADVWLKQHDQPIIEWPSEINVSQSPVRSEYIEAVKRADGGDMTALVEIHRRYWAGPQ